MKTSDYEVFTSSSSKKYKFHPNDIAFVEKYFEGYEKTDFDPWLKVSVLRRSLKTRRNIYFKFVKSDLGTPQIRKVFKNSTKRFREILLERFEKKKKEFSLSNQEVEKIFLDCLDGVFQEIEYFLINSEIVDDIQILEREIEVLIKKYSSLEIKAKLLKKGYASDKINFVLAKFLENADGGFLEEKISNLIAKKLRQIEHKGFSPSQKKEKIQRFLASKGYKYSEYSELLNNIS